MNKLVLILFSIGFNFSFAQTLTKPSTFTSLIDNSLTVKKVLITQGYDNVSGVYSIPIAKRLKELINAEKIWDGISGPIDQTPIVEDLNSSPELVFKSCRNSSVDAVLASKLTKGPSGININLSLYSCFDGLLLVTQDLKNYSGFDIKSILAEVEKLYSQLRLSMPYHGLLLSRTGTKVTLNLAKNSNVKIGESLLVIQITKLNRHPRFNFIVSVEKEILGKIIIEKADDTVSFGSIVYERESGVLKVGGKILLNAPVIYPGVLAGSTENKKYVSREDAPISTGESPEEWVPMHSPTFGKIGLTVGLGTFQANSGLETAGSIAANSSIVPGMDVDAELWITPEVNIFFDMSQNIATLENPLSGSSPDKINFALSRYRAGGSYNFLLSPDYFGPKIQLLFGYNIFKSFVDDSTPVAYTTMNYSGLTFGVRGSFPITETEMSLGADFFYHYNPSMVESPEDSGSNDSNTINQFGFFLTNKMRENMNLLAKLNFDYYGSQFSGTGTRGDNADSISQNLVSAKIGLEFLY